MSDKTKQTERPSDNLHLLVRNWWMKDSKWWQFWMPQSGLRGGIIFGLIIILSLYLIIGF